MVAAPVGQVPRLELRHLDLRKDLPPLLFASLLPALPLAQVEEVLAGHDEHLLRGVPLLRLVVPLEAAGQNNPRTKVTKGRRTDEESGRNQETGVKLNITQTIFGLL